MSLRSIVTNPYTAFVDLPSGPVRPRMAWYARYIWLLPSIRNRRGIGSVRYIIRSMRLFVIAGLLAAGLLAGCAAVFGHQYEYEEQYFFDVNGAARVVIDASVPALVALHGLP